MSILFRVKLEVFVHPKVVQILIDPFLFHSVDCSFEPIVDLSRGLFGHQTDVVDLELNLSEDQILWIENVSTADFVLSCGSEYNAVHHAGSIEHMNRVIQIMKLD